MLEKGYRVQMQSLSIPNAYYILDQSIAGIRDEICLVFTLDGAGMEIPSMGDDYWMNTMPCLCVSYFMTDLMQYDYLLSNHWGWNLIFYTLNDGMMQYMHQYYPSLEDVSSPPYLSWDRKTERALHLPEYEISVLGSYVPPVHYRKRIRQMPEVFQQVANRMMEVLQNQNDISVRDALKRAGLLLGAAFSEEEITALLPEMMVVADYVQMESLLSGMDDLLSRGKEIYVCGSSWLEYPGACHPAFHVIRSEWEDGAEGILEILEKSRQIYVPQTNGRVWSESWIGTALSMGVECLNRDGDTIVYTDEDYMDLSDFVNGLLHLED